MLKKIVVFMLVLGMCSVGFRAQAYDQNAGTKFARGVTNGVTSLIEIPKQIYLVSKEREPITGITYGMVKGVAYAILRIAEGVYDVVFFAIPPYDQPLMDPEFVFEGWE